MITVDFSSQSSMLFSGRKNGERAKTVLINDDLNEDNIVKVISRPGQLITSSFFLGLLDHYIRKFNSVNELIANLDMDSLDATSREECLRALKRGASKNQELF